MLREASTHFNGSPCIHCGGTVRVFNVKIPDEDFAFLLDQGHGESLSLENWICAAVIACGSPIAIFELNGHVYVLLVSGGMVLTPPAALTKKPLKTILMDVDIEFTSQCISMLVRENHALLFSTLKGTSNGRRKTAFQAKTPGLSATAAPRFRIWFRRGQEGQRETLRTILLPATDADVIALGLLTSFVLVGLWAAYAMFGRVF
jgi:hypothetical protein